MKFHVAKSKEGTPWVVEIPASLIQNPPALGESFTVRFSRGVDTPVRETTARFIADGSSLLLGNDIVRVGRDLRSLRQEYVRLRAGTEGRPVTMRTARMKIVRPVEPRRPQSSSQGGDVKSPMTGKVLSVLVGPGDRVQEGDVLVVIEAMKMENRILADFSALVGQIKVEPGRSVTTGEILCTLTAVDAP